MWREKAVAPAGRKNCGRTIFSHYVLNGAESTEQEAKTCRNTPSPDQLRTAASIFLLAVHGNLTIVAALIYIVPYMKLAQRILGVGASSTAMLFLVMGLM